MYVASASQMRQYDEHLLKVGYTMEELVDKASDCLFSHCASYGRIAILCGPGNNGADGVSLAIKLLKNNSKVTLYLLGDFSNLTQANKYYLEQAKLENVQTIFIEEEIIEIVAKQWEQVDLIVDGIFGCGLHSSPTGTVAKMITYINKIRNIEILSIDIPTGLDCNTGKPYEFCIQASKTISLTALKQGYLNPSSRSYTGDVCVETLAIRDYHMQQGFAKLIEELWVVHQMKERDFYGHKGTYGKVIHVTGSQSYRGAAILSAKASVYTGSGVVCSYSTKEVSDMLVLSVPECISIVRKELLDRKIYNQYDALLIGCGLGLSQEAYTYVKQVLQEATIPLVIDADALTIVAHHPVLLKEYKAPIILTPHIGEFKRFMPYINENDIVNTVREFAEEYGVVVVLKGPNTLITDGISVYRNITGNKAMATAGMGDVLAGMITSFVGQGYQAKHAAMLGVYVHGLCGDVVANESYTVIPSMLIDEIPKEMYKISNKKYK